MKKKEKILDYNMRKRERKIMKKKEVKQGKNKKEYVKRRIMEKELDGEIVKVQMIYKKEKKMEG